MMRNGFVAVAVAVALATSGLSAQSGQISGTAKDEAKTPYVENTVQVRDVQSGLISGTTTLDQTGAFTLPNLGSANYLVELVNKDGKVVCTEGPFDLAQKAITDGVIIDCNKIPAAYWLLGAAAAAGITAGVVVSQASPSR